jgi:uncharacterized membrane protein
VHYATDTISFRDMFKIYSSVLPFLPFARAAGASSDGYVLVALVAALLTIFFTAAMLIYFRMFKDDRDDSKGTKLEKCKSD